MPASRPIPLIEPTRQTLHGALDPALPPVLTVTSGDRVAFRTLDAGWGMEQQRGIGIARRRFEPRSSPRDDGPALCGPVAVAGAEPGGTLEVRVERLRTAAWGWTVAGPGDDYSAGLGIEDEPAVLLRWRLDRRRGLWRDDAGRAVRARPSLGAVGLAPAAPQPGWRPTPNGGNLDCRELTAGTSAFLPIAVSGGLLSLGDGHGAQGDGESCGMAIECPLERVQVRVVVHPDLRVRTPRLRTAAGWIALGTHEDLETARQIALGGLLDLLQEELGIRRVEALAVASVTAHLRVTQAVNPLRGIHAFISHGALAQLGARAAGGEGSS